MVAVLTILLPFVVSAQTGSQTCLQSGYTIETINGIFTDEAHAGDNKVALQKYFPKIYHGEPLTIDFLLNKTHSVLDLTDVAIQKTFEGVDMWDPDFIKILTDASAQVKTQKLLVVSHSQGNFYGNNFYKVVTDDGDVSKKSIGVYSVASPASYVAGEGRHLTSSTDKVIAFLVENVLPGIIAPTNDTINYKWSDDSGMGHDFAKVYLEYRPQKIVDDIRWSLDKLAVDSSRSEDTLCISPPKELSTIVKIVRPAVYATETVFVGGVVAVITTKNTAVGTAVGAYNVAVSTAVWTYGATVATAVWTYNTTIAVGNAVANTAVAVASTISAGVTSLVNGTGNLAAGNSAAVILATQIQTQAQSPQTLPVVNTADLSKPTVVTSPVVNQPVVLAEVATPAVTLTHATVAEKPPMLGSAPTSVSIGHSETSVGDLGGAVVPVVEVVVATTTATTTPETTASTTVTYIDGVFPAVFASTTLSSATTTFAGTYNNSTTFDRINFELKNISLDTATSSIVRSIATTTGENLPYSEEIILESEGNWQYHVRLEDSVSTSSTPWSELLSFTLATSTNATTTSQTTSTSTPQTPPPSTILFGQLDDSAHSQSHAGTYLIQTYIHSASDPTWDIKRIKLRFNPTNDNVLSVTDCKWADITFPIHGGAWNGTQNNISQPYSQTPWSTITVTADDTTKTCTYVANFGNLVSLNSGTDYDMVFSSNSGSGESMQVYGSPNDAVPGAFGYFSYGNNATHSFDTSVADAFFEFATSTVPTAVEYITPLSPISLTISTSSIAYSGKYRDTAGIFNLLKFDIEATTTTGSMSTGSRYDIPVTAGDAVPFSQTINFTGTEIMGVRWRAQAWSYAYWDLFGYDVPWNGTTGYSGWQYFTFEPAATTTPI